MLLQYYGSARTPVSYTHLDVYKRQVLVHALDLAVKDRIRVNDLAGGLFQLIAVVPRGHDAVSYTHLAVPNAPRTIASVKRKMGSDERLPIDGKCFSPQEISAMILQKLKADAEAYLGEPDVYKRQVQSGYVRCSVS